MSDFIARSESIKQGCSFPIEVFPKKFQKILNHYSSIKGYPIDYFGSSVIAALSASIGSNYSLRTIDGYKVKSNIYLAIVGSRGLNKSEAVNDAFKPVDEYTSELYLQYKEEMEDYREAKENKDEGAIKPLFLKPIINDATQEAVISQLANNYKGTTIKVDELAGLLKSFNKYREGGDQEFYLSAWSGGSYSKERVGSDHVYIASMYLSIVGTIQPAVAEQCFQDKEESGLFDRFLLCWPERTVKPYPSHRWLDPAIEGEYSSMLTRLLKFKLKTGEHIIQLSYSRESGDIVNNWVMANIDHENIDEITERERGIRAKLDIYIHRFALIMQIAYNVSDDLIDDEMTYISTEAATAAVSLCNYFLIMADRTRLKPKSDMLTGNWKELYDMLPDDGATFNTASFKLAAEMIGISPRSAERWLKDNSQRKDPDRIFEKIKHGHYAKTLRNDTSKVNG
ncbi:DUF3987 domain-containing protein [Olivibacter sp. SDN3]|uniref:DUF3987 domain-containing protein n=1 Tax=Olivibacter sp. SDN3 TaxID=2764720 RepID=UPI001650F29F|nr:DUF3987 domain-containing protein [Olivibacter sp. SDN3]QNL49241.1 DUF3987 domain-containing protein [Olivibacter sp. SDN3]